MCEREIENVTDIQRSSLIYGSYFQQLYCNPPGFCCHLYRGCRSALQCRKPWFSPCHGVPESPLFSMLLLRPATVELRAERGRQQPVDSVFCWQGGNGHLILKGEQAGWIGIQGGTGWGAWSPTWVSVHPWDFPTPEPLFPRDISIFHFQFWSLSTVVHWGKLLHLSDWFLVWLFISLYCM